MIFNMRKILLFFTFATILSACKQQEATSISTEESDEIAKTFKFASLKEQLSLKGAKTRVETGKNDFKKNDITPDITFIICSWDGWGRTSRNCRGFGLCHFKWFPASYEEINNNDYNGTSAILQTDSLGKSYIDLYLAEPIPNIAEDNIPVLSIDNNLVGERMVAETNDSVTSNSTTVQNSNNWQRGDRPDINDIIMLRGSYDYISELGTYGGYRIFLKQQ